MRRCTKFSVPKVLFMRTMFVTKKVLRFSCFLQTMLVHQLVSFQVVNSKWQRNSWWSSNFCKRICWNIVQPNGDDSSQWFETNSLSSSSSGPNAHPIIQKMRSELVPKSTYKKFLFWATGRDEKAMASFNRVDVNPVFNTFQFLINPEGKVVIGWSKDVPLHKIRQSMKLMFWWNHTRFDVKFSP